MKTQKNIFILSLLVAILLGVSVWWYTASDTAEEAGLIQTKNLDLFDNSPDDTSNVSQSTDTIPATVQPSDTLSYRIPEMGIRFEYPAYATVTVNILKGTTGAMISGVIRLSEDTSIPYEGKRISFGGRTDDFSWQKGCDQFCGEAGFSKVDNVYYYGRSGSEGVQIVSPTIMLLNDGVTEAIFIPPSGEEGPGELAPGTAQIIINTNSPRFPGISFIGSVAGPEDRFLLESIVQSVVVE